MDIAEVMTRDTALVSADATVQDAARAMAESGCRVALVGREEALEGVLTEHDILIRVVVAGRSPGETAVSEVMSSTLFTCREDQAAEEAAAQMAEHRVNQMPVLDRAGRLIGLLSRTASGRLAGEEIRHEAGGQSAGEPPSPARQGGAVEASG